MASCILTVRTVNDVVETVKLLLVKLLLVLQLYHDDHLGTPWYDPKDRMREVSVESTSRLVRSGVYRTVVQLSLNVFISKASHFIYLYLERGAAGTA